ncbi:MAG: GntR family transcriptional regulator, partial [Enterobacteriaceae bacterium]
MEKKAPRIDCRWLAHQITEYTSRGVALKVSELVDSGEIAPGSYLPSIRAFAEQIGMSPAAISIAWGMLRKQRIIDGFGRNGVWICDTSGPRPERTE